MAKKKKESEKENQQMKSFDESLQTKECEKEGADSSIQRAQTVGEGTTPDCESAADLSRVCIVVIRAHTVAIDVFI